METYLAHHGILGMKWGIRRYQNEDGTLTAVGKRRYIDAQDMYEGESKKPELSPEKLLQLAHPLVLHQSMRLTE